MRFMRQKLRRETGPGERRSTRFPRACPRAQRRYLLTMAGTAGVPAAQPCEYLAISGRDSIGAKHDLTPSIYAHRVVAFRQCPNGRRAHASPAQFARAAGAAIVIATRCFEPNTPPNARKSSDRALQRHVAALVFINGYHADSKHSVLPRHNGAGIKRYL